MKIGIYGDVHWSTYSSIVRSRGKEYSTRLENLIKSVSWAEEITEKNNCDAVICLGDFFDRPDLNAEELSALLKIKWAKGTVKEHHFIVGNHESTLSSLVYNSTNALSNNENFFIVDGPQRLMTADADILFLPYTLEEHRKSITEYWNMTEPEEVYYPESKQNRIIFSHNDLKNVQYGAYLSKEGFDLKDIENNSDLFINGHIHNGTFLNDKETILNLGILTGQNFSEDASGYTHFVCVLDTETLKLEFFENPHAFNFYKLNVATVDDLKKLTKLKNNAVITLKCEETLLNDARELIKTLPNIVEQRIITYKNITTLSSETETSTDLSITDHLNQFYNFILDNVDETVVSRDILKEELNKVVM